MALNSTTLTYYNRPDLNSIEYLWDEIKCQLRALPRYPTNFIEALGEI